MIFLARHKIVYWPIPKNACTSMKFALYQLDTGRNFRSDYDFQVHAAYPTLANGGLSDRRVSADHLKCIIVRDPIERFISGFSNRVVYHNGLADIEMRASKREAAIMDINEFAARFEFFLRKSSSIHHHFQPQMDYVRHVLDCSDLVVDLKEISKVERAIQERAPEFSMERRQTGNAQKKASNLEINEKTRSMLLDYYAEDYRRLEPYLA